MIEMRYSSLLVASFVSLHLPWSTEGFIPSTRQSSTHYELSQLLYPGNKYHDSLMTVFSSASSQQAATDHSPSFKIDPLLTRFISYQQDRIRQENEDKDEEQLDMSVLSTLLASPGRGDAKYTISSVSHAIQVWKRALATSRCPLMSDFENEHTAIWPPQPLFSLTSSALIDMELPRMAKRHPETIPAIIRSLLTMTLAFSNQYEMLQNESSVEEIDDKDEQYIDDCPQIMDFESKEFSSVDMDAEVERIAKEFVNDQLVKQWATVAQGVSILDDMYGVGKHDLLNVEEESTPSNNAELSVGFGLEDAIWKHSGWQLIPTLQRKVSQMPELKQLVNELGRRPTIKDSDSTHKFHPRKRQENGSLGAEWDPQIRESVNDLYFSNKLFEMLPSEAVLLKSKTKGLKSLFLQKLAESKLLSYQYSGWSDVPSVQTFKTRKRRMPSAPGGPILICLDTSWSMMTASRETLSKAVVLAMVQTATAQHRSCQVVAFSSQNNVIESGIMTSDNGKGSPSATFPRLLDFLSNSFGGGTDVTGALKFALEQFEDCADGSRMNEADIVLISDGEIPDPPVSQETMNQLDILKLRKGVQIHGLLVGKRESKPLERLCTSTHDFLNDYDEFLPGPLSPQRRMSSTSLGMGSYKDDRDIRSPSSWTRSGRGMFKTRLLSTALFSMNGDLQEWNEDLGELRLANKKEKRRRKESRQKQTKRPSHEPVSSDPYLEQVQKAVETTMSKVKSVLDERRWSPSVLTEERETESSCWRYRSDVDAAIRQLSEGLVERSEEARLVVLALLSNEHILLIGSPGTGKSVLGRRLANLCSGSFFQRLLTRFTAPEELFGPLSLKSLENDEYVRVTKGYLPTASIAFLDEIFKANSAILNTLLTILNERKFDNAGGQEDCELRCVMGASNELPESDELAALFDRFLIRKKVRPVTDEGLLQLLSMTNSGHSEPVGFDVNGDHNGKDFSAGLDELIESLAKAADEVELKEDVANVILQLRTFMREELLVEISDRRMVKAARLLKLSAASEGRSQVDSIDCLLLQHCFWELPEQRQVVQDWLLDHLVPGGMESDSIASFRLLLDGLRDEIMSCVRKTNGDVTGSHGAREADLAALKSLQLESYQIKDILELKLASADRFLSLLDDDNSFLWLDKNDMDSVKQSWIPKAKAYVEEIKTALSNAMALIYSVDQDSSISNEIRLSVIDQLWEAGYSPEVVFPDAELEIGMKEAKAKYDLETFRKWKRAKKALQ